MSMVSTLACIPFLGLITLDLAVRHTCSHHPLHPLLEALTSFPILQPSLQPPNLRALSPLAFLSQGKLFMLLTSKGDRIP